MGWKIKEEEGRVEKETEEQEPEGASKIWPYVKWLSGCEGNVRKSDGG